MIESSAWAYCPDFCYSNFLPYTEEDGLWQAPQSSPVGMGACRATFLPHGTRPISGRHTVE